MARKILKQKICIKCNILKKRAEFFLQNKGSVKIQSICKICSNKARKEWGKRWLKQNPKANTSIVRNYRAAMRQKVLKALGGKCKRCGFDDWRALQIDHVKGGGYKERKEMGHSGGPRYYLYVMADKTGRYQILCANCNWIKRYVNNETAPRSI